MMSKIDDIMHRPDKVKHNINLCEDIYLGYVLETNQCELFSAHLLHNLMDGIWLAAELQVLGDLTSLI